MSSPHDRSLVLPVAVVGALALLAGAAVLAAAAFAQGNQATCSTGVAVTDPANNPGLVSDCEALLASRDTLAGTATLNWSADKPVAEWDSVTVGGQPPRVTRLRLNSRDLTGEIPLELGKLSNLQKLNLGGNRLMGEIPLELGQLANLQELVLGFNRLTGEIPPQVGELAELQELRVMFNELSGAIPPEVGDLASLRVFASRLQSVGR